MYNKRNHLRKMGVPGEEEGAKIELTLTKRDLAETGEVRALPRMTKNKMLTKKRPELQD